ncbi:MAG: hypothetical protein HYU37_17455 [Acidobacteria bacterium]|nr:hypothetical protein [Acidobacteriota bacterium]
MLLSRRTAIKGLLATAVGTVTGAAAYGAAYERHRIGLTSVSLPVSGLPPALDGLRIGFLTDIHHSRTLPAADVTRAVELALGERPDLIVLGGDYVTFGDRAYVGPVAELLAPLHAPHGVYSRSAVSGWSSPASGSGHGGWRTSRACCGRRPTL